MSGAGARHGYRAGDKGPAGDAVLTPSLTIGPLYGFALMFDGSECAVPEDSAEAVVIGGSIFDGAGNAITYPDAMVEVWHGDQWARARVDVQGAFRVVARKPEPVSLLGGVVMAPHLNIIVFASGLLKHVMTRLYFPDEAELNARDPLLSSMTATDSQRMIARRDGTRLRFDVHLQGAWESVFFHC